MKIKDYKKLTKLGARQNSHDKLKRVFNLFIRLRDFALNKLSGSIEGKCIGCGKKLRLELISDKTVMNGREHHASHYFNTDKYPSVEFYEDNVHLSCKGCNRQLHGNKDQYQINLLQKIGQERFDKLIFEKNQIKHYNVLDYEELVLIYRTKAKVEKERLGIR